MEYSISTDALITRLAARARYLVLARLATSRELRFETLAAVAHPEGEAQQSFMPLAATVLSTDGDACRALGRAANASFACELERGLLQELRSRFAGIGQLSLATWPRAAIAFMEDADIEGNDRVAGPAAEYAASTNANTVASVTGFTAQQLVSGYRREIVERGLAFIGELAYWAYVAAIQRQARLAGGALIPYVGTFARDAEGLRFVPESAFIRIIQNNLGMVAYANGGDLEPAR